MTNGHRNADHTDRSFYSNLSAMSIMTFCRAVDTRNAPATEPDMFSRWIRLTDDLLAASWKPRKRSANRNRSKFGITLSANPA